MSGVALTESINPKPARPKRPAEHSAGHAQQKVERGSTRREQKTPGDTPAGARSSGRRFRRSSYLCQ
jgi:hypothetical protein